MTLRTFPILMLMLALGACFATAGESPFTHRAADGLWDLDDYLERCNRIVGAPALAAIVVTADGVAAAGAVGLRSALAEVPVTRDDLFHIGSCTKAMTATMIARLVEAGALDWRTGVLDLFPELAERAHPAWRDVTLSHLLTNSSGAAGSFVASHPEVWRRFWMGDLSPRDQRELLVGTLLVHPPEAAPGSRYLYSNSGFAMAGAMAERATGQTYEALMREHLFAPLGMTSAGFGAPGGNGKLDQPLGHHADGRPQPVAGPSDNPAAIAPAGRVHLSLADWAAFVRCHLTGWRSGNDFLSVESFRILHTPFEGAKRYAMGWLLTVTDATGEPLLLHSGSNTMWYATVGVLPESGVAILIACNRGGARQVEDVAREMGAAWLALDDEN